MFPFFATLLMMLRSVLCHAKKRSIHVLPARVNRVNPASPPFCSHNGLLSEYSGHKGKRFPALFYVTTIIINVMLRQAGFRSGFCLFRFQSFLKALAANLPYHLSEMIRYVTAETYLYLRYVEVDVPAERLLYTSAHRSPTCVTSFAFSSSTAADSLRGQITSYY